MASRELNPVHPGEILLWLGLQMDYELDVGEDMLEGRPAKEVTPRSATG